MDLFDIDGNGVVDPGEEYLAFRIWEEMNGIDEEEELPDTDRTGGASEEVS